MHMKDFKHGSWGGGGRGEKAQSMSVSMFELYGPTNIFLKRAKWGGAD